MSNHKKGEDDNFAYYEEPKEVYDDEDGFQILSDIFDRTQSFLVTGVAKKNIHLSRESLDVIFGLFDYPPNEYISFTYEKLSTPDEIKDKFPEDDNKNPVIIPVEEPKDDDKFKSLFGAPKENEEKKDEPQNENKSEKVNISVLGMSIIEKMYDLTALYSLLFLVEVVLGVIILIGSFNELGGNWKLFSLISSILLMITGVLGAIRALFTKGSYIIVIILDLLTMGALLFELVSILIKEKGIFSDHPSLTIVTCISLIFCVVCLIITNKLRKKDNILTGDIKGPLLEQ